MALENMEELVSFCKKKGFVFQGSEIYGGLKGTYDMGPLGVELKKNIRSNWWRSMIYERDDIEGLESSLLSNRLIWKYSGHEDNFSDPLVECKKCHSRMRQDKMKDQSCCDYCGSHDLTEPKNFLLMMKTNIGPVDDGENFAYLRAETAQGTYLNFKNVLNATSRKLPFGIAQHGKSFRNEITPRNFLFRQREFEQAEMQFFINPAEDEKWFEEWKNIRLNWWINNGIAKENLQIHPHDTLSHYAKAAVDIEYKFPWGYDEVEGVHNRQDYDLGSHTKSQDSFKIHAKVKHNVDSNEKMSYRDLVTGEEFLPFVIETAMGVDRAMIAFLSEAYTKEKLENGDERVVLKLNKTLAPVKAAIVPLAKNNDKIVELAHEIKDKLLKLGLGRIVYENTGNIGKAYRRNDEIGTPICVTVDFETIESTSQSVTIRDRDTMKQVRVNIDKLEEYITEFYKNF